MSHLSVNRDTCNRDGLCAQECPIHLITLDAEGWPQAVPQAEDICIRCGHCMAVCPHQALSVGGMDPAAWTRVNHKLNPERDQVVQFLKSRRSVRLYKDEPVDRETLAQVLDVTRWSPTGINIQPVNWLVYDSPEGVRRLAGMLAEHLRAIEFFPQMVAAWDAGKDAILRSAPCVIIAHAWAENGRHAADCIAATTTLDLAARAFGLGGCWAGILMMAARAGNEPLLAELALPEGHAVFAAMMLGKPKHRYALIPERKPIQVEWR